MLQSAELRVHRLALIQGYPGTRVVHGNFEFGAAPPATDQHAAGLRVAQPIR